MDKNTLSNYGWIVIAVLVLSVMIALATPFGHYVELATKNTLFGLIGTSDNALQVVSPLNNKTNEKEVQVDGLGTVTVNSSSGNEVNLSFNNQTGELTGNVEIPNEENASIPESELPETISFEFGTFETYTPVQYETVKYEVVKTRTKEPALHYTKGYLKWSTTNQGGTGNLVSEEVSVSDIPESGNYIVYTTSKDLQIKINGISGFNIVFMNFAMNTKDTKESAVYLAAFSRKANNNKEYHVAKWNGSKYEHQNYESDINAITEFTETYTETERKQVKLTESDSKTYTYKPNSTLVAEKGMTWKQWINSSYNTLGIEETDVIRKNNLAIVDLNERIDASNQYGFQTTKALQTTINIVHGYSDSIVDTKTVQYEEGQTWLEFIQSEQCPWTLTNYKLYSENQFDILFKEFDSTSSNFLPAISEIINNTTGQKMHPNDIIDGADSYSFITGTTYGGGSN